MANFTADFQTFLDGPVYGAVPATRVKANRAAGRIRFFSSVYRAPPSGTAPAIGDKIIWGKLPTKARVLPHLSVMTYNTGTASCTLNLGDQYAATRYLAATAIDTAGATILNKAIATQTAVADVTISTNVIASVKSLGAFTVGGILTGTGIPTGTYVTAVDYQARTVTMSAVATATNAAVAITTYGAPYETQDDSSGATNAYASTTDDCTLIGVVAGAQIANNQMLSVLIAYVQD